MTVRMQSLEEPLSQEEIEELHKLLKSEPLLERMVERAVRGIRESERRPRKTSSPCLNHHSGF